MRAVALALYFAILLWPGAILRGAYFYAGAGAVELVVNGGFESFTGAIDDSGQDEDFSSWTEDLTGGHTYAASAAHGGAAACRIDRSSGFPGVHQDTITVTPGANLTLRYWTKGDGTVVGYHTLYDLTNSASIADAATGVTGGTYTEVVVPFTVPPGCVLLRVYFYADTNVGSFWVDDVSVQ